jgi:hypothetical protein
LARDRFADFAPDLESSWVFRRDNLLRNTEQPFTATISLELLA